MLSNMSVNENNVHSQEIEPAWLILPGAGNALEKSKNHQCCTPLNVKRCSFDNEVPHYWRSDPWTKTLQLSMSLCLLQSRYIPLLSYQSTPRCRLSSVYWVFLWIFCRRCVHVRLRCKGWVLRSV